MGRDCCSASVVCRLHVDFCQGFLEQRSVAASAIFNVPAEVHNCKARVGCAWWLVNTPILLQAQMLCFQLSGRPLPPQVRLGGVVDACRPQRICPAGATTSWETRSASLPCCKRGHVVWKNCVFGETTSEAPSTGSARIEGISTSPFGRSCGPLWSQSPVPCCVASDFPGEEGGQSSDCRDQQQGRASECTGWRATTGRRFSIQSRCSGTV